jgi:hypothetical protein
MAFDFNLKNEEAEKLFRRLNDATDATVNYIKKNEPSVKKGLKGAAAAGGAGLLVKGIQDARMNKYQRDKLKSEKGYYERMNQKLDDEARFGGMLGKKASAKDKLKSMMSISPEDREMIKDIAKKLGMSMAGAGAVSLGAKGGGDLYQAVRNKLNNQEEKYWEAFIRRYPEFEDNPESKQQFKFFYDAAPDLAKHPIAVKSFMKQIEAGGTGTMHFNNIKDVTSIQDSFNRRDNGAEDRIISGVNNILNSARDVSENLGTAGYDMARENVAYKNQIVNLAKTMKDSNMTFEEAKQKVYG